MGPVLLGWLVLAWTASHAGDWPRFLGPSGDGKSPETEVVLEWKPPGPPVLFRHEVGEAYAMPVVSGGRLFLFDRHGDVERLTCLDAKTGAEIWRSEAPTTYVDTYGYGTGPRASPLVDGDHVYTFGAEGRLRCHAAASGKLVWEVDTTARFAVEKNFFGVGSSPIVEGDLLIVAVGGKLPAPAGSSEADASAGKGKGAAIVAFDKRTGKLRYATGDEQASYTSPLVITIGERRWGFLFARGGLLAFEPSAGTVEFHFPWRAERYESVNAANPVVVGDTVLVTESYGLGSALLRVRPGGYDVLRKDSPREASMASHWGTPIHHDGVLYGSSGQKSGNAELRAIDWSTGEVHWRKRGLGRVTLLWVRGHLVVLTERGRLLVVEAKREAYREVASTGEQPVVGYPAWNAPILADGILYVRGDDRLVAFDLRPPKPSRSAPTESESGE